LWNIRVVIEDRRPDGVGLRNRGRVVGRGNGGASDRPDVPVEDGDGVRGRVGGAGARK